jgi:SAM-dependent methyltransferase
MNLGIPSFTYWNSAGGRRWVERQQSQDIVLDPILQATLERAQLRQGERVVDISCGTGASSIALAERAGPSGEVLGIDVSTPMLAAGCRTAATGRPGQICTRQRDDLPIRIGRFRPPFFALWRHVFRGAGSRFCESAHGLKPSGRLAFACWRKFDENLWLQVPLRAAFEHVPPLPRPGRSQGEYRRLGDERCG